ncbi:MAG: serine acetyltransferase [Lachnospiraceae bacterium]|nr:serine acetyltransferase [Candidatus Colinaster scatohippi]
MKRKIEDKVQEIIGLIQEDYDGNKDIDKIGVYDKPDKAAVIEIVKKLFQIVYPGYFMDRSYKVYSAKNSLAVLMEDVFYRLNQQIELALRFDERFENASRTEIEDAAEDFTEKFLAKIPQIREYVETDLEAEFDGDPAAGSKVEIILAYPGLMASTVNRLAHELYLLGIPLIPRLMTEYAHTETGIDIHPGATIGKYFFIDHGTGIVVGETTVIGEHVKLYQGVTLGALSTRGGQSLKNKRRHPTIEDNVVIYSGASILGGDTIIGHDSVIGGNAFITSSVPAGTRVK